MMPQTRNFTRGFLPTADPLPRLPAPFAEWEAVGAELSKLALTDQLRPTLAALPPFPVAALANEREYERALTLLCFMGALYVWAPAQPAVTALPTNLAVAWHAVATQQQRPPVMTYASQALYNWRRIDPQGPIAVGNLTMIQNFLGGQDEEWFALIHVNIEAVAGRALAVLLPAQAAIAQDDADTVEHALHELAATLQAMHALLLRMPERCDPYIYYHRMRPFMFGWKDNPLLPGGLIYPGVAEYGGQPQQFRGETGAQSSVIYALEGALGLTHEFDAMRAYLLEMRDYMPAQDRAFIEQVERGPSIREYVATRQPGLRASYNYCLEQLERFRQLHIEYAALYIIKPAQGAQQGEVGTGGTPFTVYLKKHIRETHDQRL